MAAKSPCLKMLTGKPMPQVGLGTWMSSKGEVENALRVAVDAGYRHIDTARMYNNEGEIGEALEEMIKAGKVTRDEMFITTKVGFGGGAPHQVRAQTDIALKLLRTDYIDLLLIHFPIAFSDAQLYDDPPVFFPKNEQGLIGTDYKPIEIYREMEKLVDAGLVKAIGLSNFNKHQIQTIWDNARIKPSNLQVECHAWFPQNELVDFCKEKGITFSAYSPIGSPGGPTVDKKDDSKILLKDPVIVELAKKLKKTPAQILLRNLIQRGIIVLPKSVNKDRIISNFQLFDFTLSDEEMEAVKGVNREEKIYKFDFMKNLANHPEFPWSLSG